VGRSIIVNPGKEICQSRAVNTIGRQVGHKRMPRLDCGALLLRISRDGGGAMRKIIEARLDGKGIKVACEPIRLPRGCCATSCFNIGECEFLRGPLPRHGLFAIAEFVERLAPALTRRLRCSRMLSDLATGCCSHRLT
jgi:hypothetical protein